MMEFKKEDSLYYVVRCPTEEIFEEVYIWAKQKNFIIGSSLRWDDYKENTVFYWTWNEFKKNFECGKDNTVRSNDHEINIEEIREESYKEKDGEFRIIYNNNIVAISDGEDAINIKKEKIKDLIKELKKL